MYKIHAALAVVLLTVCGVAYKLGVLTPVPTSNVVIAEKSDIIMGGQIAMVVPDDLSAAQHLVLTRAYEQAKADGHPNPEVVQSVLLQESKAGAHSSYKVAGTKGNEYFGLGQLKLTAARDVMKAFPVLWDKYKFQTQTDDELKANLILNAAFNIEITSKYLRLLQTRYGFKGRELLNAYNRGPAGVKLVGADYHYAIAAEAKLAEAKKSRRL